MRKRESCDANGPERRTTQETPTAQRKENGTWTLQNSRQEACYFTCLRVCVCVCAGWLVGLALVCAFVCAFVSAFVCSFRGLFACVLSWVEIYDGEYLFLHDCAMWRVASRAEMCKKKRCARRARAPHTRTRALRLAPPTHIVGTRGGQIRSLALSRRRANRQTRTTWARRSLDATYSLLNATLIKKKAQPTCQKTPARRSHMT